MNIVILGATGGIGSCLSKELSLKNNLYLGYRDNVKFDNLKSTINSQNLLSGETIDIEDFDFSKNFLNNANDHLGSIDCIISCLGSLLLKPAHLTSEDDLVSVFNTNVFSSFSIIKHSFKHLRKNGGNMIFFSSAAANVGLKNHDAIGSAKGALSSLVTSSASTYAKYNIRINAIAPGLVETPLTQKIVSNDISLEYSKNLHGLDRIGKPENFIPIIKSLIDPRSDWITGQTIHVDGGLSNVK
tara:strand:- start:1359 stop:2087 length:729 start_codon:yes stop_codon:yes gene_type:complete